MISGHWISLPILIPLAAGLVLLLEVRRPLWQRRLIGMLSTLALLGVAVRLLLAASDGVIRSYAVGDWPAPFGIVLVLDRLAATMVLLTALLALPAFVYAIRGVDRQGANFHPLFQFQLAGLNGAFLTGDLFNLFVFFEVLLIASYALLLHGQGAERSRAGFNYVMLNLTGSALFLVGVGLVYGATGTLNMADINRVIMDGEVTQPGLLVTAGLLLLVVFALKAAVLPLNFWLPRAYSAATPPVAALFAIMTKVGVYAILRLWPLLFAQGELAQIVPAWLWWLGLATLAMSTLGVLAADRLSTVAAWSVLVSIGTLMAAISTGTRDSWAGALYYLLHTTWVSGALFLVAGLIGVQRGEQGDHLRSGPALGAPFVLGGLLLVSGMAVAGVPPLSGFIGKLSLLQAMPAASHGLFWILLLVSGFASLVALSRAGSTLFWRPLRESPRSAEPDPVQIGAAMALAGLLVVMAFVAEPLLAWTGAVADQIISPDVYVKAVLGAGEG